VFHHIDYVLVLYFNGAMFDLDSIGVAVRVGGGSCVSYFFEEGFG
jgi:hypothetical protein